MWALPAPAFVQDARTIAEQITRKWEQAVNAGDAAVLTALYTKDAALLPHGIATPQIGEISIRSKDPMMSLEKPARHRRCDA